MQVRHGRNGRGKASYNENVSWWQEILYDKNLAGRSTEAMKYAEVKALVGGTTAIQGQLPAFLLNGVWTQILVGPVRKP